MKTMAPGPDRQGGECRPQQGGRAQEAYIQRSETECQQVSRQQNCHIAIGEGTQRFADQKRQNDTVNALRQQPSTNHLSPRNRPTFFKGVSPHHA